MSEIIKKLVEENKSKVITLWLKNNFKFTGKLINSDETFIEILDHKTNSIRLINIDQISEIKEESK